MNRNRFVSFLILLIIAATAAGQSPIYPFSVIIGGQTAELESQSSIFAKIKAPVEPDAIIKANIETQMVIINAFPCDEAGNAIPGKPPAIILIQGGNSASLAKTMDSKRLAPGSYVANVVANGKTSRVFFVVQ